jgi:hypothetical protein
MKNKPYRKGDRLIESLASGVVVFDLNKFIVSSFVHNYLARLLLLSSPGEMPQLDWLNRQRSFAQTP